MERFSAAVPSPVTSKAVINGTPAELSPGTNVGSIVDALSSHGRKGIAVALNGVVVPRSAWDDTVLLDEDVVEILTAAQGG